MLLADWLIRIGQYHPQDIAMGLGRITQVAAHADLLQLPCPVITIGGTNGKGSTVAGLEAVYLHEGYQVFASTSPTLLRYNERLRINGIDASDALFCDAFEYIEKHRCIVPLTFFEMSMLAILYIIKQHAGKKSVALLEVGLGGRLDAVNIIDPQLAIVTNIDIDHTEYLGDTREKIAFEKAGIFRENGLAICGDRHPPHTLLDYATQHHVALYQQGKEYDNTIKNNTWQWHSAALLLSMQKPRLYTDNLSTVIMALQLMQSRLPVSTQSIIDVLPTVTLAGRFDIQGQYIYDVAHNPAGVRLLVSQLLKHPCTGKRYAVFSMLADKEVESSLLALTPLIDEWHIAPIHDKRAMSLATLTALFDKHGIPVQAHPTLPIAIEAVKEKLQREDQCIITGSFHTVGEVKHHVSS